MPPRVRYDEIVPEDAPAFVEDATENERQVLYALGKAFPNIPNIRLVYLLARNFGKPVSVKELIWTFLDESDTPEARRKIRYQIYMLRDHFRNARVSFRIAPSKDGETYKLVDGNPDADRKNFYRDDIPNVLRNRDQLLKKFPDLSFKKQARLLKVNEATLRRWVRWDCEGILAEKLSKRKYTPGRR